MNREQWQKKRVRADTAPQLALATDKVGDEASSAGGLLEPARAIPPSLENRSHDIATCCEWSLIGANPKVSH